MSAPNTTAGLIQSLAGERALFWCVLASIALHALVLLGLSWGGAPAPPAKTLLVLTARLAPFAAAPRAAEPQPEHAPPLTEPVSAPRPALTKPAASPAPATQKAAPAEPLKVPQPESAAGVPGADASAAPSAAPIQARPAPQAPAGSPATEAAARSGNEADTGTLEQYRLALI